MELSPILPRTGREHDARWRTGRLAFGATVGRETLDARIAALQPLREALDGTAILIDDGTLAGADRVRLARECGDPEIVPASAVRWRGFPTDAEWALLLAMLDRRQGAYAIIFGGDYRPEGALAAIAGAIASNRSFAVVGEDAPPTALEPHLATLAEDGWPCLSARPLLAGLAAGGGGPQLASAVLARIEGALGKVQARRPEMAGWVAGFVLARERDPLLLPRTER